jgi:hypothetical protein
MRTIDRDVTDLDVAIAHAVSGLTDTSGTRLTSEMLQPADRRSPDAGCC